VVKTKSSHPKSNRNFSYSGSRDQEDYDLKPNPSKLFLRPYLENTQHEKKGLAEWLKW
jgi:hypothetical protein